MVNFLVENKKTPSKTRTESIHVDNLILKQAANRDIENVTQSYTPLFHHDFTFYFDLIMLLFKCFLIFFWELSTKKFLSITIN
jgi:hypothetical protein